MEVSAAGSTEGVGVFFNFKSEGNELDEAQIHFFLPAGTKTVAEIESFVTDSNGLIATNGWQLIEDTIPPKQLEYPWVEKILSFSAEKEMMGYILLGETNNQALQVTLIYPEAMAENYWNQSNIVLEKVEFAADLLPIKISNELSSVEKDSQRSDYNPLPLPEDVNLIGNDLKQIALGIFGMSEPVEGNFEEKVSIVEKTDNRAILTLTQTGLLDDSVEATRYWLEFIRNDQNQWQLNWSGRQIRCYSGRGSQIWDVKNCL